VGTHNNTNKLPTKLVENIKSYNTPERKKILVLIQTGAELMQTGNYSNAIICYDLALAIDPDDSNVLVNKGAALTNLGRYEEAKQCYDKVLAQKPDSSMALYNKACIIAFNGETDESLSLLEKAISLDSNLIESAKTEGFFVSMRDFHRFRMILG